MLYRDSAAREPGRDPPGIQAIAEDLTRRYPGRRRVVVPRWARSASTGEPAAGRTSARGARRVRPRHPAGLGASRRPTSTRSSWRCGSTAPRRATATPRHISPSGPPMPRRRASVWRTSSWRARERRRANSATAFCGRRRPQPCGTRALALGEAADSGEAAVAVSRALAAAPPGDAAWLGPAERELGSASPCCTGDTCARRRRSCSRTRRRCRSTWSRRRW